MDADLILTPTVMQYPLREKIGDPSLFVGRELSVQVPVYSGHNRTRVVEWPLEVGRAYRHRLTGPEFEPFVLHEYSDGNELYLLRVYVTDEFENRHHYSALSIAAGDKLNADAQSLRRGKLVGIELKVPPNQ